MGWPIRRAAGGGAAHWQADEKLSSLRIEMMPQLLCAYFLGIALAFHCSNDAPIEFPSPEKAPAWSHYAPAHVHSHSHSHSHSMPLPGYRVAEHRIERALAQPLLPTNWTPPTLVARPLSASSVTLLPGGRGFAAQNLSLAWMLSLDPERLLYSFRATANLSTNGVHAYGGWEDAGCLLRGHIAGGHWLSGAALLFHSTGSAALLQRATYVVSELQKCQAANTAKGLAGYLSAFPEDHFTRLETNTQPIWAPYYTMHKILQGLYDMHVLCGDGSAREVAQGMISYFAGRIRALIARETIAAWYAVMNIEHGGMNEISYKWFALTASPDAEYLARMFDTPCWLGPLSLQADVLTDEHANTHLPVVLGAATQYEGTGDLRLGLAATGFYAAVTGAHTFSTGGSSSGEWWGHPHRLADQLDINGVETCSTYNILKLSRQLFGWGGEAALLGDYERAKFSGMFGTQHPSRLGAVIYLLPLRGPNGLAGGSKARSYWGWSDPEDSMWCCVGTAMESHSKHGDSLYYEGTTPPAGGAPAVPPTLFVALYDTSAVAWQASPSLALAATMKSNYSSAGLSVVASVEATPASAAGAAATLAFRVPAWATLGTAQATVNGASLPVTPTWLNITRTWQPGVAVQVTLWLPFQVLLEPLDDDRPENQGIFALTVSASLPLPPFPPPPPFFFGIHSPPPLLPCPSYAPPITPPPPCPFFPFSLPPPCRLAHLPLAPSHTRKMWWWEPLPRPRRPGFAPSLRRSGAPLPPSPHPALRGSFSCATTMQRVCGWGTWARRVGGSGRLMRAPVTPPGWWWMLQAVGRGGGGGAAAVCQSPRGGHFLPVARGHPLRHCPWLRRWLQCLHLLHSALPRPCWGRHCFI